MHVNSHNSLTPAVAAAAAANHRDPSPTKGGKELSVPTGEQGSAIWSQNQLAISGRRRAIITR